MKILFRNTRESYIKDLALTSQEETADMYIKRRKNNNKKKKPNVSYTSR